MQFYKALLKTDHISAKINDSKHVMQFKDVLNSATCLVFILGLIWLELERLVILRLTMTWGVKIRATPRVSRTDQ